MNQHRTDWRPWRGVYEVTSDGQVRNGLTGHVLKHKLHPRTKHHFLHPVVDGQRLTRCVHTLVLETFVGPRPEGMEARHLDDDKDNNTIENLRWGTSAENRADAVRNGCMARGVRSSSAKLTERDVLVIRSAPGTHRRIAESFGVSRQTIGDIKQRKNWAWLA